MTQIIDSLGTLTGLRDRDVLDVTLVGALRDMLRPRAVAVYRCVGEGDDRRWLTRARLEGGDIAPGADSMWADTASLPRLFAEPQRARCLLEQDIIESGPAPGGDVRHTCVPLATECGPLGVVEITHEGTLSDADRRMLLGVTRIYLNFLNLLDYSERDTLTGLLNRKTFDDSFLKSAVGMPSARLSQMRPGAAGEGGVPCWLGVIDIDHFKKVNDTYGHLIGDEVLLLVARLLRSTFRLNDLLYRFGGEEFVVLLRCGDTSEAQIAFERLRTNIEAFAFPQIGRLTVSVGFTQVREGDTPAEAFARADQAVYHAKEHGRNQVVSHAALVSAGEVAEVERESDVELF